MKKLFKVKLVLNKTKDKIHYFLLQTCHYVPKFQESRSSFSQTCGSHLPSWIVIFINLEYASTFDQYVLELVEGTVSCLAFTQ